MGILLASIALFLLYALSPFLIIYSLLTTWNLKRLSGHFFRVAVAVDQLGNVIGADFFNMILIRKEGFQFGDEDETISSVLGRNYKAQTLLYPGQALRWILDKIEKNHCINSIGK